MVKCPLGERWETTVGAVNPTMIIVLDISKDNRLNHVLGHLHRIDTIKFFFLERCEKALHPGIIIVILSIIVDRFPSRIQRPYATSCKDW